MLVSQHSSIFMTSEELSFFVRPNLNTGKILKILSHLLKM